MVTSGKLSDFSKPSHMALFPFWTWSRTLAPLGTSIWALFARTIFQLLECKPVEKPQEPIMYLKTVARQGVAGRAVGRMARSRFPMFSQCWVCTSILETLGIWAPLWSLGVAEIWFPWLQDRLVQTPFYFENRRVQLCSLILDFSFWE